MFLSYLKLSLRLLARNPFFTFINVAGLSIGFAVFFILWPFTQAELRSDQFIKDHDRIYRPILDWRWQDSGSETWGHVNLSWMWSSVGSEMQLHEQVEDVCRISNSFYGEFTPISRPELLLSTDEEESLMDVGAGHAICTDRNFLQFFGIPLLKGNQRTALDLSEFVVLSETMAGRLFNGDGLNRQLKVNGKLFLVTGVFKDLPGNSHLQFDLIFSNAGNLAIWNTHRSPWSHQYFKMKKGASPLADLLNENKDRLIGSYLEENQHIKIDFLAQPLEEVAFSQFGEPFKPKSKFTLNILAGVSLMVLMMAWMNYVNLTVSRTRTRFKEIAVRKVSGALIPDLFVQFVCQSAVINLLAVLIGLTLIQVARQPFSLLFEIKIIPLSDLTTDTLFFFAVAVFAGIIATASYPAWITIRHNTRQLLTKNIPSRRRVTTTIFTTSQYVAALTMIVCIFVMHSQLNFILSKDLGIDKESVVVVNAPTIGLDENGNSKMVAFADELQNKVDIRDIALSGRVCGDEPYNINLRRTGNNVYYGSDSHGGVDNRFIPLYNIKIVAGRNFIRGEKGVTIIISRVTAGRLGFKTPEEAVGATIEYRSLDGWKPIVVVGVVEDYRVWPFYNLEGNSEAATGRGECLFFLNNAWAPALPERVSVKVDMNIAESQREKVEKIYHEHFPGNIFNWYFLDDKINRQYGDQKITRNQITFFTLLAVGVASLGLLGMISNKVVEKLKEISVRRILGAGIVHILSLLLGSTGIQIALAAAIGIPVAWKISQQYLEKYTDHIAIQWWHFALPVTILIAIMFSTIASVLWKTAKSNPVEALRTE